MYQLLKFAVINPSLHNTYYGMLVLFTACYNFCDYLGYSFFTTEENHEDHMMQCTENSFGDSHLLKIWFTACFQAFMHRNILIGRWNQTVNVSLNSLAF